jgi:2-oxo-4-hydroxy-4-carboxy-5-ureidoimidazoline decarboxylase
MTVAELSASDRAAFVGALGWIFEDSPWVAERAWERRPFASLDDLHAAMTGVVAGATEAEQLALLRAHPDLGTRARVSDASTGEQRGAGLDRLTADEFARLQRLNMDYRSRFGFPFLFAVKGSTTHDVLAALDARGRHTRDEEFAEALQQVYKIARFRLEGLIGDRAGA